LTRPPVYATLPFLTVGLSRERRKSAGPAVSSSPVIFSGFCAVPPGSPASRGVAAMPAARDWRRQYDKPEEFRSNVLYWRLRWRLGLAVPIVVPPFVQYQAPLNPLRGLWNHRPPEGDRYVQAEINWLITTKAGNAVQFELSGNSPVAFSQIVALAVDNSRCSVSTTFLFPDSGFALVVPAYNQGIYPVITNALMFYCFATGAVAGDRTIFLALNAMPPPLSVQPFLAPQPAATLNANVAGITITANSTTPIIAAGVNGTLVGMSVNVSATGGASAGIANLSLADGSPKTLWATQIEAPINTAVNVPNDLSGLNLKFTNGINLVIANSLNFAFGSVLVNLYYTVP
jgi:hypothetical protein